LNIEMTGRHMEITARMRDYAGEKAARLDRYFDRIQHIQIILESEGEERHKAEMLISVTKGTTLVSQAKDSSVYAAIDLVLDKAERQLTRYKEKLRARRGRRPEDDGAGALPGEALEEEADADIQMDH